MMLNECVAIFSYLSCRCFFLLKSCLENFVCIKHVMIDGLMNWHRNGNIVDLVVYKISVKKSGAFEVYDKRNNSNSVGKEMKEKNWT